MFEHSEWTVGQRQALEHGYTISSPYEPDSSGELKMVMRNCQQVLSDDHLHLRTRKDQELLVNLEDFDGNNAYTKYSIFAVGSESENYKLSVSRYSGTAGDSLLYSNGRTWIMMDGEMAKEIKIREC